jgi:hypothetical protein
VNAIDPIAFNSSFTSEIGRHDNGPPSETRQTALPAPAAIIARFGEIATASSSAPSENARTKDLSLTRQTLAVLLRQLASSAPSDGKVTFGTGNPELDEFVCQTTLGLILC